MVSQLAVLHNHGIVHGDINPDNISIHQGQRLFAKLANVGNIFYSLVSFLRLKLYLKMMSAKLHYLVYFT